jgi:hypothetical protein
MSVEQYQRNVNSLDKEIADLEKKKATKDKEIANLQGKINSTSKSITKNTAASIRNSKIRQISGWESDVAKKSKDSADFSAKIADKRKKRSEAALKLQKAERDEQKKTDRQNAKTIQEYENRVNDLQHQIIQQVISSNKSFEDEVDEEYDVFISHAWEDKEDFVDELVEEMRKLNIRVWYDTDKLKWGDSMREKIDKGLSKSRFGVVVLSPDYIREDKYWTKAELNGLFQVETINGKTILPIWHKLTKKQVTEYSPIIADRKALTTAAYTAEEIAQTLKNLFFENDVEEITNGQA